jgi:hypothetical protein
VYGPCLGRPEKSRTESTARFASRELLHTWRDRSRLFVPRTLQEPRGSEMEGGRGRGAKRRAANGGFGKSHLADRFFGRFVSLLAHYVGDNAPYPTMSTSCRSAKPFSSYSGLCVFRKSPLADEFNNKPVFWLRYYLRATSPVATNSIGGRYKRNCGV